MEKLKFEIKLVSIITKNTFMPRDIDNSFIIFNSINNILHMIYSTRIKSIISYDLNKFQIITEIKNPHENQYISNFRHFLDQKNLRDLILSISYKNCNIKIWNSENWSCILNLKNIYSYGIINSSCFISDINKILICVGNNYWNDPDYIKIFGIDGTFITNINNSKTNSYSLIAFMINKILIFILFLVVMNIRYLLIFLKMKYIENFLKAIVNIILVVKY